MSPLVTGAARGNLIAYSSRLNSSSSGDLTDPYISNVSLLLHMDGTNNSTTFTDSSSNTFTPTVGGNAAIKTAESKFGGASGYFDGQGDYLQYSYNSKLDLIGVDFTVESWIYPTSYKANGMRIAAGGGGTVAFNSTTGIHWLLQLDNVGKLSLQYWNGSSAAGVTATGLSAPSLYSWTHVALSVSGTTAYLAVGGSTESGSITGITRPSTNPSFAIGTIPGENGTSSTAFVGYIDDVRVTKSVARYTSNFTPRTTAFPNS